MHICFLCYEYPPAPHGGIGSFVQTLGRALVARGEQVTAIGVYPDEHARNEDDQGVRVIRLSRKGPPLFRIWQNRARLDRELLNLDRATPIDILESGELDFYNISRSAPGIKLLRMHGGPNFFAVDRPPPPLQNLKERLGFRVADQLCAVSHAVADGTRRVLRLGDRPIEVIPNPIDVSRLAPSTAGLEEPGLIVFVGTVTERKGIRELVAAMPAIVARIPQAHLEVYGGDDIFPDGREPLSHTLAASLTPDLARRIVWKGRVSRDEVERALRRASVCAYPSRIEAMPLAWLEGMAAGKAVMVSRTGPGPEIVEDGVTGLLCDPYDPASIAAKLIALLEDEALRRRLGGAARRAAVERYSLDLLVDRNIAYYRSLLSRKAIYWN